MVISAERQKSSGTHLELMIICPAVPKEIRKKLDGKMGSCSEKRGKQLRRRTQGLCVSLLFYFNFKGFSGLSALNVFRAFGL